MKNLKNKKGFTLVELVIVIAVIAILAAVLIPTFSNVVAKANASKELQQVTNAYKEALAEALADDGQIKSDNGNTEQETVDEYVFVFTANSNGDLTDVDITKANSGYSYDWQAGKIIVTKNN